MIVKELTLDSVAFPEVLRNIPTPPSVLYVAGDSLQSLLARPRVTIVGSRKITPYGQAVTTQLATALAQAGVVIVSGLAYGVDAAAHRAALQAGGLCIAVLAGSLDTIYPSVHRSLADTIVQRGGVLISEQRSGGIPHKGSFVIRNRIAAGLGNVTLIIEAAVKSGTLHTARFALEQGKAVMAVPGNITSPTSHGTNQLLKSGALMVTEVQDILDELGIHRSTKVIHRGSTPAEQAIVDILARGEGDGSALQAASGLDVQVFNQSLTMLEITGKVKPLGNNRWALV